MVNSFLAETNIDQVRSIQKEIYELYIADAQKYDQAHRLKIQRIFQMIPSAMENKKKRMVAQAIEGKRGKCFTDYQDEFDYLISAGVALEVNAISNPVFPLFTSHQKNLLKLYLNDVGLLTSVIYKNAIKAIIDDTLSINLGSVYESFVAQELKAHKFKLYYYDNKKNGEVDYLIDDFNSLAVLPIAVKSGKDYRTHSALNHFVKSGVYPVKQGLVLSNDREIKKNGKICYMPIYNVMFFESERNEDLADYEKQLKEDIQKVRQTYGDHNVKSKS